MGHLGIGDETRLKVHPVSACASATQALGLTEGSSTSNLMRRSSAGLVLMLMEVLLFGPQNQLVGVICLEWQSEQPRVCQGMQECLP